jgi:hypothetical protein
MMPNAIKRHMVPAPLTQTAEARKKCKISIPNGDKSTTATYELVRM